MKYNFSKEWCEKMARLENGASISAGAQELAACPVCRNTFEKQWCECCARTGVVLTDRQPASVQS